MLADRVTRINDGRGIDVLGIYRVHWHPMVRLAVLLVDDVPSAEDAVQEAFISLYRHQSRVSGPDAAAAYLRQSVVNRCRSIVRRRVVARRKSAMVGIDPDSSSTAAIDGVSVLGARSDHTPQPGGPTVHPSGSGTTAPASRTFTTTVGSAPSTAAVSAGPGPVEVTLAGATIDVPSGWFVVPTQILSSDTWCLGPQGQCLVMFRRYDPAYVAPMPEMPVSGDNAKPCHADSPNQPVLRSARVAALGGRQSDYRMWTVACPEGIRTIAQYVVSTAPAYELVTDTTASTQEVGTILATMDQIAASAKLPAATPGAIRSYDQGHVESAKASGDGFDIVLRHYTGGGVNDWVRTDVVTTYHLPASVLPPGYSAGNLGHEALQLYTDGTTVIQIVIPGG